VQLQYVDVLSAKDINSAFREARTARADAVLVLSSPVVSLSARRLRNLRRRVGYRSYTRFQKLWKQEGL